MSTLRGGPNYDTSRQYGVGTPLDPGNLGQPGVVVPSSGGVGIRCMLSNSGSATIACWVLRNGVLYTNASATPGIPFAMPEPIVGLFTVTTDPAIQLSDIMAVGASGSVYNLGAPSVVAYALPVKPEFCGFIVESGSGLNARGAFYASGEGKAYRYASTQTWVGGVLQTVTSWTEVVLSQVKPGAPNTPLPFDNVSMLYSGVPA